MIKELLIGGSWLQTGLIGLVTGLLVYWLIHIRKYPPGPFALPLLGNVLQLDDKQIHKKIFKIWSKKYGPVVTVRFGPIPIVIVNNLETAMEVLVKKSTDFAGRKSTPSLDVLSDGQKDIALGQYSPTWKLQRKVASSALRHYMQGAALENRVHQAVEIGLQEMEKQIEPFDPKDYIDFIVTNILAGVCFAGRYEFNDVEVRKVLKMEDELLNALAYGTMEDFIPGLKYVYKTKGFKTFEDLVTALTTVFIGGKFDEAKKTFNKDNQRHLTDCLLLARKEAVDEDGSEMLTDVHLIQTISDVFFAGLDTTRLTLRFAILHMLAFPDIQAKVHEELDRVVGRDRLPGMADRPELSYTEAVLHESMRLSTVAPFGLPHMALCDSEIAGHKVPSGTQVIINHWALHNDPDAWSEPDRFIPERFLDENGRLGPKPPSWLPFSAGKRVCLGEFVAKPDLHLLFASLMQRFEWRHQSGYQADFTPDGSSISVHPKEYKVVLTKRLP